MVLSTSWTFLNNYILQTKIELDESTILNKLKKQNVPGFQQTAASLVKQRSNVVVKQQWGNREQCRTLCSRAPTKSCKYDPRGLKQVTAHREREKYKSKQPAGRKGRLDWNNGVILTTNGQRHSRRYIEGWGTGGGGGQIETRVLFNKRLYGIVSLVGRQSEYIKLYSRDDQGAERAIEPQAWANTPPPPNTTQYPTRILYVSIITCVSWMYWNGAIS